MKVDDRIISQIKESNNVAIFIHTMMDSDCIGSACALKIALEQLGKQVDILAEDKVVSKKYLFIPEAKTINKPKLQGYDLAIAVDVAALSKLGKESTTKFKSVDKNIKIDHHVLRVPEDNFAKLNFVKEDFSSASMIIYYLLPMLGIKEINKDMALCLYSGISGDTGCFRHSNTTPRDHEVAAKLMETGIDSSLADWWLFKYTTAYEIALKHRVLGRFKKYVNDKMCLLYVLQKDLQETHTSMVDTESLVFAIEGVEGCELSVVITEKNKGLFKASFRSNKTDVALKVAQSFGGGGHPKASGCQVYGTVNTVISKIEKAAKFALDGQQ